MLYYLCGKPHTLSYSSVCGTDTRTHTQKEKERERLLEYDIVVLQEERSKEVEPLLWPLRLSWQLGQDRFLNGFINSQMRISADSQCALSLVFTVKTAFRDHFCSSLLVFTVRLHILAFSLLSIFDRVVVHHYPKFYLTKSP